MQPSKYLGVAAILLAGIPPRADAVQYSWQEPQAEVLSTGDLRWKPSSFVFRAGDTLRYIDYENGDDDNSGSTNSRPWKHHPWDSRASGQAKADPGLSTYIFKRGVTYRGRLVPNAVGTVDRPIILTSDPSWGQGEAVLSGAETVTGWLPGGDPAMPDVEKVWHADLDFLPRAVWLATPKGIRRLALARTPNWEVESWDDIHSQWATWKRVDQVDRNGEQVNRGIDSDVLGRYSPEQLVGAIVWSEYDGFMGTAYPTPLLLSPTASGSIEFSRWVPNESQWAEASNRYFLEDRPAFLDAPGEFWLARKGEGGRLYVRLPGDVDPSTTQVEAARHLAIIDATKLDHVHIRGLTFRCTNLEWNLTEPPLGNPDVDPAAIRLEGSGRDIVIDHCRFEHVSRAVRLRAAPDEGGAIDDVLVTDNDVRDTDHGAFLITDGNRWTQIAPPYAHLGRVTVLRNHCERIGFRPYQRSHGQAIEIEYPECMEVAGNILGLIHGPGLFLFGGGDNGQARDAPLSRHLIYQNRVSQSLLGTNDWGGIATWQVGPFYIFNNVSIDPGGYHHVQYLKRQVATGPHTFSDSRFGFAYCFDGSSKNYVFNNIALGRNNNPASQLCNTGAFHEILAQDNIFFNNTAARFAVGFVGFNRPSFSSLYLGNVLEDMSLAGWYFSLPQSLRLTNKVAAAEFYGQRRPPLRLGELGLANNFLSGSLATIGTLPGVPGPGLSELSAFQAGLARLKVADASVGKVAPEGLLPHFPEGDLRPLAGSSVTGRGARVFVPWALYACVAEWNFCARHDDPDLISDDHWYLTWGYLDRSKYASLPRHDLHGIGITLADFVAGPLNDWAPSALRLDGRTQYLILPDSNLYRPTHVERMVRTKGKGGPPLTFNRSHWRTPDVGTSSFLIEAYLRPASGRGGLLLAKYDGRTGYVLELDQTGRPVVRLEQAGRLVARTDAATVVADNAWHHLVVEINRARPDGITFWIDGRQDKGTLTGEVAAVDLDNNADVLVGGGPGNPFIKGELSFLRICLGTFADAHTDIDELRAWEFAGPQFADFTGRVPPAIRDAGALQCHVPLTDKDE